mmetsp:Transcript_89339/g.193378  ORF Transcript_89339/g.193378 Transcript_89339/m.193378 type:complete len:230 (-) Transcript_89339:85-774(-)
MVRLSDHLALHDLRVAAHLLLLRLALHHDLLLEGVHHAENVLRWALVAAVALDCFQLRLVLGKHATVHNENHHVDAVGEVVPEVTADHLHDAGQPRRQADGPQDAVVAGGVHQVEAGLHEEAVSGDGVPQAAAHLRVDAVAVLRLPERSARAKATAADVRLLDHVEDLETLLGGHADAAAAAAAVAELPRSFAGRLEQANFPVVGQRLCHFLLDRHGWHSGSRAGERIR